MSGHPQVEARLRTLSPTDQLLVCPIVVGEILFGLEVMPAGKRKNAIRQRAETVLSSLRCEPVPPEAAIQYARLKSVARRAGTTLDENDLWIASTAATLDAILVTSDSDYTRVSNLPVQDWTR
jgi:predicted nucleic acid-binding protein